MGSLLALATKVSPIQDNYNVRRITVTFRSRILSLFLVLLVGISVASAQTSNGTVLGVITDSSGGALVGATVTITSTDTGSVRTTLTNSEGTYRIESVLPGNYDVSASATGFQTTVHKGLQVPGTAIVTASLVLKVGSAVDKVEVSADNAVLNTDNGQLSGTIGEEEIHNLPIASLNPYELALTLPGVMNTTVGANFTNGVVFNVGGGRPRANNFLIEGQDNNDAGIQGQGLQPGNDEAVKQVVIIENAYTAEYGHGAGSVSNLIFKSGTNQWHGSLYERLQNSSLDTVDKKKVQRHHRGQQVSREPAGLHDRWTDHPQQALRLCLVSVGLLSLYRQFGHAVNPNREWSCHSEQLLRQSTRCQPAEGLWQPRRHHQPQQPDRANSARPRPGNGR